MKKHIIICLCFLILVFLSGCENSGSSLTPTETTASKTKTIYVATSRSAIFPDNSTNNQTHSYQFNDDGFPIEFSLKTSYTSYSDYYVYDYTDLAGEMASLSLDYSPIDSQKFSERIESVRNQQKNVLAQNGLDSSVVDLHFILSIDTDKQVIKKYMCLGDYSPEGGIGMSYDILSYDTTSKTQSISEYRGSELWYTRSKVFNQNYDLISQEVSDILNHLKLFYKYSYDSLQQRTQIDIETIREGSSDSTYSTCYYQNLYSKDGYLIKRTNYDTTGNISSEDTFTFTTIQIPTESIDLLCQLYSFLGIPYYLAV